MITIISYYIMKFLILLLIIPTPTNGASSGLPAIHETFTAMKNVINTKLFLYETPMMEWIPSTVYQFNGFFAGLKIMQEVGVAGLKIYLGGHENDTPLNDSNNYDCPHCYMYGLINVAAFLAQAMKETIRYDACDENSWDRVGEDLMYPISNSCGQLGQSYQDYHCSEEERHMECPVDPQMTITAMTNAKWWGAPGPLTCGPKSKYPKTGYWDFMYACDNIWANPPETCDAYVGQEGGKAINDVAYPNAAGRTDVEGCCWWGRGVIQTSGVCNFGKLNYFLGKRAADEGRESRYPTIDFCKDPEAICSSKEHKELKWIAGFFYWINEVQPYERDGWNYIAELHKFVEGGMVGDSFINAVSGIVNRGCHNPPCGTGELDGGPERAQNFREVIDAMKFSFIDVYPVDPPKVGGTPKPPSPSQPEQSSQESESVVSPPNPSPAVPAETPPTPPPVTHPAESFISADTVTANSQSSVLRYTCGDGYQDDGTNSIPPSAEVVFDYEIHNGIDVTVKDGLRDVKASILSDIADRIGCQKARRKLQYDSTFESIIGLQSNPFDMPDLAAMGQCIVEVELTTPTTCTPTKGAFTFYSKPGTSETSMVETTNALKNLIQQSMDAGKYETSVVDKAIYIGERENLVKDTSIDSISTQTEGSDDANNGVNVGIIYALAVVCFILTCLLCCYVHKYREKKREGRYYDEEAILNTFAMDEDRDYQESMYSNNSNRNMMMAPQVDDYLPQTSQRIPPPPPRQTSQNQTRRSTFENHTGSNEDHETPQYNRRSTAPTSREIPNFIGRREEGFSQEDPSLITTQKIPPKRSRSAPRPRNQSRRHYSDDEGVGSRSDTRSNGENNDYNDGPVASRRSMSSRSPSRRARSSSGSRYSVGNDSSRQESFNRSNTSSSAREDRQRRMEMARARASNRRSFN